MSSTPNEDRFTAEIDAAITARHAEDYVEARRLCPAILAHLELPQDKRLYSILHNELGIVARQVGDYSTAERHYRWALAPSPRYELASLGLFHSLLDLGLMKDAVEEAIRFVGLCHCADYRMMFTDAFDADVEPPIRALVDEVRRLLRRYETMS